MSLRALQGPTGGGAPVGGSGTANTIPRWDAGSPSTTLTDSGLIDNGTAVYTSTRRVGVDTSTTLANVKFQVGSASSLGNYQGAPFGVILPAGSGSWLEFAENSTNGTAFRITKDSNTGVILNANGKDVGFDAGAYESLISGCQMVLKTSGFVGIGTASPGAKLEIPFSGTAAGCRIQFASGPFNYFNATNHYFRTLGDADVMTIVSTNVGIGTTGPDSRLHVTLAGLASLRIGYAGTSVNYYDAGTHNFRDGGGNPAFTITAGATKIADLSVSGWGLKLPATPGNPDTQTLDAYQEIGTGTPAEIALTLTCGTSGTITVNAASSKARVTRVGNKVIGHGRIVVSSVSAPLGRLSCVLTGCPQPFTNFLVETQTDNTTGLASGNRIVGTSDTAATPTIYFDRYSPNTSSADAAANIQAGTIIVFNICYSV